MTSSNMLTAIKSILTLSSLALFSSTGKTIAEAFTCPASYAVHSGSSLENIVDLHASSNDNTVERTLSRRTVAESLLVGCLTGLAGVKPAQALVSHFDL